MAHNFKEGKDWATPGAPDLPNHYFVAPDGDDGTGDGSSANPWATPSYAYSQITTGDTLIVYSGKYTDNITWSSNLIMKGDGRVIFTGDITIPGGSTSQFHSILFNAR